MQIKNKIKKSWNWVWHSDSIWSWIVALAIIYIVIKFIFFPGLSLLFGTSLPLAGVESSSMDHQIARDDHNILNLCGKIKDENSIDFNQYWETCGNWYEENNITKEQFSEFPLKDGFKKGDIIIVWGRFKPKIGDIIVFKVNPGSTAPRPIIHRIVSIDEQGTIQTKGDHNAKQLTSSNNIYKTDETKISQDQIIGKAIMKIPLFGWPKIWASELINAFK